MTEVKIDHLIHDEFFDDHPVGSWLEYEKFDDHDHPFWGEGEVIGHATSHDGKWWNGVFGCWHVSGPTVFVFVSDDGGKTARTVYPKDVLYT